MATVVIERPQPIVTPADVAGDHAPDDASVAAVIEAVTEDIDGPSGWLGRCLGVQTLEQQQSDFLNLRIRYVPVVEIVSVEFTDRQGVAWFIPPENYRVIRTDSFAELRGVKDFHWPTDLAQEPDAVRIQYKAGYDDSVRIGPVPQRARQAIILAAQQMLAVSAPAGQVRSEDVEGVGSTQYLDGDKVSAIVKSATERLLSTLRIYA